ncbi:hypothetical protein [Winogradskyella tangerina]|uniref:hypothetical protein n=1 Tax=Winogradskyella tangerina TaxID=2023240 RepID=UPI000DBE72B4|nr:hypothetical protein [Winogradskyella tangerina]
MKKLILFIAIATTFNLSFSQNFDEIATYEFKDAESYSTEKPKVLACANYLFNNPVDTDGYNRLLALQYIMKWMEGTPDYTFEIGSDVLDLTKGSDDLFGLYLAAMSKVVLEENGDTSLTSEQIHDKSVNILVDYCANKSNNIKPSKKIKKLIKKRN